MIEEEKGPLRALLWCPRDLLPEAMVVEAESERLCKVLGPVADIQFRTIHDRPSGQRSASESNKAVDSFDFFLAIFWTQTGGFLRDNHGEAETLSSRLTEASPSSARIYFKEAPVFANDLNSVQLTSLAGIRARYSGTDVLRTFRDQEDLAVLVRLFLAAALLPRRNRCELSGSVLDAAEEAHEGLAAVENSAQRLEQDALGLAGHLERTITEQRAVDTAASEDELRRGMRSVDALSQWLEVFSPRLTGEAAVLRSVLPNTVDSLLGFLALDVFAGLPPLREIRRLVRRASSSLCSAADNTTDIRSRLSRLPGLTTRFVNAQFACLETLGFVSQELSVGWSMTTEMATVSNALAQSS